MTLRSRDLPICTLTPRSAATPMTSPSGSNAVSPAVAGEAIDPVSGSLAQQRSSLRRTTSRACLALAVSLGAGLPQWPHAASAQQITQGGGNGSGYSFGSGGIAGGGGGSGDRGFGISGSEGGSAAQTPGGSASAGGAGANDVGGSGGAGGAPGAPNDLSAGGGGGGGRGGYDPGFPRDGGAGGAGGGGNLLTTTSPLSLGSAYAGGTGATGSFGGSPAGSGGGGGGGGGLILTGAGVTMNTNGFAVSGGAGAGGAGAGGGGAGLVLLNGGTITVAAGAGGTSIIAGGRGADEYEGGNGGAGLFLYNGGSLSHQAGSIIGGAGGAWAWAGSGGTGVLSNLGIIDNRAAIAGGKGGDSNAGGTGYGRGGAGLEAWGGSIANTASGSITGGAGGNQSDNNPVYVAGVGGAGIVFRDGQTASLDNAGTISGGRGGTAASSSHGAGGVGIVGAASGGISIVNSGTIAGGLSGDGVTQANAVELFGSNNRFEIQAGSTTTGNVVVQGGGANNVLALGGSANGAVDIGNLAGTHTGFTAFEKTGLSTWTLSGTGSQNWSIREGTLSGSVASMAGNLTFATGAGTRSVVFKGLGTYSGTISGDGSAAFAGFGNDPLILANAQNFTGMTTIRSGILRMGVANALAPSAGIQINNGTWDLAGFDQTVKGLTGNAGTHVTLGTATLSVDNATSNGYFGAISGSGGLTKTGPGYFELRGVNTYAGATNVAGGVMRLTSGGTLLNSTAINVSNNARFIIYGPNALSPTVTVGLNTAGSEFEAIADQQIGSLSGVAGARVWLNQSAVLTTGASNTSTVFSGTIGADGNGSLTKVGSGAFTLTGANGYTGATLVNGGSLIVNGSLASSSVSVGTGATLGGSGTIAGGVTIASGGTLSAGNSPGTLTVASLALNAGSNTIFELNSPGVVGGATNDHIIVNGAGAAGNLQLGGTLTANVASAGYYRLFDVTGGGAISGSFDTLALTAPSVAGATGTVYNAPSGSPNQVNLAVVGAGQNLQFWDGADAAGNGTVDGGAGTWKAGSTNWTVAPGELGFNAPWLGSVGVFQGTAGAVTVAGTQDFDTLQFNSSGYVLGGGSLRFGVAGGGAINTAAGITTTIGSSFIDGAGTSLTKVGAGTLTLSGTNSYTGATVVNAGSLLVNGSIASSSGLTVAAGATLGGSGTLPSTVINGTLSPGNSPGTLTVNGNLTLNAGSTYLAEVQGANADRVNVTGTASLAGTLRLVPLGGSYAFNSAYTLLSAAGGRSGQFGTVDPAGTFGDGVATAVSYTANDVLLTLQPKPLTPEQPGTPGLGVISPRNARAVATAIDIAVAKGADPSSLFGIYNLPAAAIPAAVNSLSGEVHTAAPAMASVASDQFLRTMLDPTAAGRLGDAGAGPGAAAFSGLARKGTDQAGGPSRLDQPFYSVWGAAYGSHGRTDGNAAIGSGRRIIDDAHLATGIDIRLMPGMVAGLAVSAGKAQASLPGLTGKIDADVFQAGLYGLARFGPAKIGAALSYARLDNDVSRGIPALGSSLSSSYATTAWSGRLQASAAVLNWNGLSVSPLAAIQGTQARSPAVVEANWAGASGGALALAGRSDVTARGELGLQIDSDTVLAGIPVTGYARAAWAHYFRRDADLTASLAGLPGAVFTATGARPDRNSALVNLGVTARLSESMTLGLSLDGEFSANSNRLGGAAQLRVSF